MICPICTRTLPLSLHSYRKIVTDHARLTHEIELFYYTKRDSQVVTPIGWATVASYREEDQMLTVTFPFCRPPARMWIPVEKVPTYVRTYVRTCVRARVVKGNNKSALIRMGVLSSCCSRHIMFIRRDPLRSLPMKTYLHLAVECDKRVYSLLTLLTNQVNHHALSLVGLLNMIPCGLFSMGCRGHGIVRCPRTSRRAFPRQPCS